MHLSKALPQARKNAQGIIHPIAGVLTQCAVLAKIVVVFWINGLPAPVSRRDFSPASSQSLVVISLSTDFNERYYIKIPAYRPNIFCGTAAAAPGQAYKPSGPAIRLLFA